MANPPARTKRNELHYRHREAIRRTRVWLASKQWTANGFTNPPLGITNWEVLNYMTQTPAMQRETRRAFVEIRAQLDREDWWPSGNPGVGGAILGDPNKGPGVWTGLKSAFSPSIVTASEDGGGLVGYQEGGLVSVGQAMTLLPEEQEAVETAFPGIMPSLKRMGKITGDGAIRFREDAAETLAEIFREASKGQINPRKIDLPDPGAFRRKSPKFDIAGALKSFFGSITLPQLPSLNKGGGDDDSGDNPPFVAPFSKPNPPPPSGEGSKGETTVNGNTAAANVFRRFLVDHQSAKMMRCDSRHKNAEQRRPCFTEHRIGSLDVAADDNVASALAAEIFGSQTAPTLVLFQRGDSGPNADRYDGMLVGGLRVELELEFIPDSVTDATENVSQGQLSILKAYLLTFAIEGKSSNALGDWKAAPTPLENFDLPKGVYEGVGDFKYEKNSKFQIVSPTDSTSNTYLTAAGAATDTHPTINWRLAGHIHYKLSVHLQFAGSDAKQLAMKQAA